MNPLTVQKEMYAGGQGVDAWLDVTVGDNIDRKIKSLQEQIDLLKASKESLKPLLSMRIRDIQQAMNY